MFFAALTVLVSAEDEYVARTYVEYEGTDGTKAYIYSDISKPGSIAQVAKSIVDANPTDGYLDSLCAEHQKVVTDWADKYVAQ